jgi:hypothetical protein
MDEIQGSVVKRGKRNLITRLSRGNDKEAIAAWRLEFDEILHVFNVRSVTPARSLLTCRFQTELAENTRPTVSDTPHDVANIDATTSDVHHDTPDADVRHNVPNTHPIDSEVQSEIANIWTTSSNIHRNKLKSCEYADDKKQPVSITDTLTATDYPLTTT